MAFVVLFRRICSEGILTLILSIHNVVLQGEGEMSTNAKFLTLRPESIRNFASVGVPGRVSGGGGQGEGEMSTDAKFLTLRPESVRNFASVDVPGKGLGRRRGAG